MFKIEYEKNGIQMPTIYSDDIKDVGQILINIVNNERAENEAVIWCGQASWGDNFINQRYKFSIQCVYDEKHILKPGTPGAKLNKHTNPFKDEVTLINVANEISKRTGIKNRYVGYKEDGITVNWDFDYKLSYMTNNAGQSLSFYCKDKTGKLLWSYNGKDINDFVKQISERIILEINCDKESNTRRKIMKNFEIVKNLSIAKSKNVDVHFRIYDDGCWIVDIDRFKNGLIRFWVSFEDKRNGHSRASLVSLAWLNGELSYNTDGIKIKKAVWEKIQSTAKALADCNLYNIDTTSSNKYRNQSTENKRYENMLRLALADKLSKDLPEL